MSIALHSASVAARMFLSTKSPEQFHLVLRRHLGQNMRLATALSRLMVSGVGRALAPTALSLMPGSLRWIADATRIPHEELVDAAHEKLVRNESAHF